MSVSLCESCRLVRIVAAPVDVVLVTPDEAERYRNSPGLVICPALKEGKVVYIANISRC